MFGGFDFAILVRNAPFLWAGMVLTLQLTALAVAGGLALGLILAVLRLSRIPLVPALVAGYVNFLRSMPLILAIFWFYTLIPKLTGQSVSSFYSVLIAFILFEAAYYSEIIRAGTTKTGPYVSSRIGRGSSASDTYTPSSGSMGLISTS